MFSGPCLRLRILPSQWHHGISSEYSADDDIRKVRRRVNANGLANADVNVTFNDGKEPPKSASSFRCDLWFHGGGELPLEPDDHAPKKRHTEELVSKHCGWLQTWDDEGKVALSVELHAPDEIFNELYDRMKLGF